MKLELSPGAQAEVVEDLKRYFEDELDQEIGDLKAGLMADFIYERIAPAIYRQAILDAQAHLQDKLLDMEALLRLDGEPARGKR